MKKRQISHHLIKTVQHLDKMNPIKEIWLGFGILFCILTIVAEISQWSSSVIYICPSLSIIFQVFAIESVRQRIVGERKPKLKNGLGQKVALKADIENASDESERRIQLKPLINHESGDSVETKCAVTSPTSPSTSATRNINGKTESYLFSAENENKDALDSTHETFFPEKKEIHAKIYPDISDNDSLSNAEPNLDIESDFSLKDSNRNRQFDDSVEDLKYKIISPSQRRKAKANNQIASPSNLLRTHKQQSSGWDSFAGARLEVKVEASHTVAVRRKSNKQNRKSLELEERIAEDLRKQKEFESIINDIESHHLETPLAKAVRILERVYDIFEEDEAAQDCISMVLDILGDTDSLHSVVKSLNDMTLTKETKNWVAETLATHSAVSKSSAGRWGQLRNISKKIGLKQLIENNRRMKCRTVKIDFSNGRCEDFVLQPLAPRLLREKSEASVRENRRLGTQRLFKAENEDNDHLLVQSFYHPLLNEHQHNQIQGFLETHAFLEWDFDILEFQEVTNGHALWFVAMFLYSYHDHIANFQIQPAILSAFIAEAERTYCFDPEKENIYHNALHAADVALNVGQFCENEHVSDILNSLQGFALITAAIMHDYRHPGLNNAFLMRSADQIALIYNDSSVLENFHASEAFRLLSQKEYCIFTKITADNRKNFRSYFIKTILATDLAHAFEFIDKFNSTLHKEGGFKKEILESQLLLMQFTIKCADICHPAKPWNLHSKWSDLITKEFFKQGEEEAKRGLPVSPLCDAAKVEIPKSQCNFIDFLVRPCFEPFSEFCSNKDWMKNVESNYEVWQNQGGQNNVPKRNSIERRTSVLHRRKSSSKRKSLSIKLGRKSSVISLRRRISVKGVTTPLSPNHNG